MRDHLAVEHSGNSLGKAGTGAVPLGLRNHLQLNFTGGFCGLFVEWSDDTAT